MNSHFPDTLPGRAPDKTSLRGRVVALLVLVATTGGALAVLSLPGMKRTVAFVALGMGLVAAVGALASAGRNALRYGRRAAGRAVRATRWCATMMLGASAAGAALAVAALNPIWSVIAELPLIMVIMCEFRGTKEVSHGGASAGYRTFLTRSPDHRLSVAVLANTADCNGAAVVRSVAQALLDLPAPTPARVQFAAATRDATGTITGYELTNAGGRCRRVRFVRRTVESAAPGTPTATAAGTTRI